MKRAKSWLAILTYYCAQGQTQLGALSERLWSLYESILKPEILQETIRNAIPKTLDEKEAAGIKKRIMSRLTPNKIERRILSSPKIPSRKALAQGKLNSFTLGRLVVTWAVLTHQSTHDFMVRVYPNINRLYRDWRDATGCRGLSDEECRSHPKESALFWSGIYRTLIQATPEENLLHFMQDGIHALGAVIEAPGLGKMIHKLLRQAGRVMTKDTAKRIESALKENPYARERINIPEFKALVLREEAKLGWSKNTDKEAFRILRESLSPELKEAAANTGEIIKSSIESVGRRGLFNNLLDALNGKLRPRFIESIMRFLKSIVRVDSSWEFETSTLIKENTNKICSWLFRRKK